MERRDMAIHKRVRCLKTGRRGAGPVVYWMSRDQRVKDNWALLWAQQEARSAGVGLVVVFCLVNDYPEANLRHYGFLLRGLAEVAPKLRELNIGFRLLYGPPPKALPPFFELLKPTVVVGDFDPLRIKRQWQQAVIQQVRAPFYEVDAHNIVPAWVASTKKEYGAYTIRPKLNRLLPEYLTDFPALIPHPHQCPQLENSSIDTAQLLDGVQEKRIQEVDWLVPGELAGHKRMHHVLETRLPGYSSHRNDPCQAGQSDLSPYLHFGQLAPQRLAWDVKNSSLPADDRDSFLEELIVRRELSDNFCLYEPAYDSCHAFPDWAQKTHDSHRHDPRDYTYTRAQFEQARTHEALWNACQLDLIRRGKLHGYLRMYWAKKILEWTASPEEAMAIAITLNDRYSLDGRDPNGYAGIAWSIGGVHDRAWRERPVFGKIRYMNLNGCRRKFDVDGYIGSVTGALNHS